MSTQSPQPDPEDLTEMALRGVSDADKALFDEAVSAEYERLSSFVDACRDVAPDEGRHASLAVRALDTAQNEDLSWRGDLRLLGSFVQDGVRSSALMRVAAASLLVHLVVLPVVAFYALTEEPVVPEFRVDVGGRELPYSDELPTEAASAPLELEEFGSVQTLLVENSLRWSRWQLVRGKEGLASARSSFPSWLRQRVDVLLEIEDLGASEVAASTYLAAELALDSFLVGDGSRSSVGRVQIAIDTLLSEMGPADQPETWLALSALARAESYGVLGEDASLVLAEARKSTSNEHIYRALIEVDGDLRRRLPIDPLWVKAYMMVAPAGADSPALDRLLEIDALQER